MVEEAQQQSKSPLVASALSVFIPGAGQLYAERLGRGIGVMLITIALTPIYVGIALWLW